MFLRVAGGHPTPRLRIGNRVVLLFCESRAAILRQGFGLVIELYYYFVSRGRELNPPERFCRPLSNRLTTATEIQLCVILNYFWPKRQMYIFLLGGRRVAKSRRETNLNLIFFSQKIDNNAAV